MRLLLDSHLSIEVATRLCEAGIDVVALSRWLDGVYRTARDETILEAAFDEGIVFVTYDLRTIPIPIPILLKEWAESGRSHGGVVLVDEKSIRPNDVGGLVHAIRWLVSRSGGDEWVNRVVFLHNGDRTR